MSLRDLGILAGVCLLWALNTIFSKIAVTTMGIPPLFLGAVRFGLVGLVVCPFLFPAPRPLWRLLVVGLAMGGGTFALAFIGLKTASPSAMAIVSQLGVPATTLLSVLILGETIHWRRGLGIVLSLSGVLLVMWNPQDFSISTGLLLGAAGAIIGSFGAVTMKQMDGVKPLTFQAWVGVISFVPLMALSLILEPEAPGRALAAGWPFVGIILFSALAVSVLGHTTYYMLIQRYEANLIAPLTLMMPLMTIALGVAITHDPFTLREAIGTAVALTGVLIIALRRDHVAPLVQLLRPRA
ncbi:MAG: DMT family transporter [Alphaproteobacteria bacterium]